MLGKESSGSGKSSSFGKRVCRLSCFDREVVPFREYLCTLYPRTLRKRWSNYKENDCNKKSIVECALGLCAASAGGYSGTSFEFKRSSDLFPGKVICIILVLYSDVVCTQDNSRICKEYTISGRKLPNDHTNGSVV